MFKDRKVLIFGGTGQDGSLLASYLVDELDYNAENITVTTTSLSESNLFRLQYFKLIGRVNLRQYSMDADDPTDIIQSSNPDYVYLLSGSPYTTSSIATVAQTSLTNTYGFSRIIESLRDCSPDSSIFIAGSSEMYGSGPSSDISVGIESNNLCMPTNPYGASKLYQYHLANQYREYYGLDISYGILFNHESELRGRQFVSKKIVSNLVRYKLTQNHKFSMGNLSSERDWSSASDFVRGFATITENRSNKAYIFSSGTKISVRDFVIATTELLELPCHFEGLYLSEKLICDVTGKTILDVSTRYYRTNDTKPLFGDSSPLMTEHNWERKYPLNRLIQTMIKFEFDRQQR